jgi:hypothetical protein
VGARARPGSANPGDSRRGHQPNGRFSAPHSGYSVA